MQSIEDVAKFCKSAGYTPEEAARFFREFSTPKQSLLPPQYNYNYTQQSPKTPAPAMPAAAAARRPPAAPAAKRPRKQHPRQGPLKFELPSPAKPENAGVGVGVPVAAPVMDASWRDWNVEEARAGGSGAGGSDTEELPSDD